MNLTGKKMFTDIIILAGGFGERLWPASKADFPKQFMRLDGGISFLQHAILRSIALKPEGKIIIATRDGLQNQIASQCKELILRKDITDSKTSEKLQKDLLIFAEPFARHTTAPILACTRLLKILKPEIKHSCLVLTSDHIIEPIEAFYEDSKKAYVSAKKNHIVTFGIQPYEPSTGYGYILTGNEEENNPSVFKIKEFKEKPDKQTAQKYIAEGNCRWNSGMYAFDCDFFEEELKKCTPEISRAFKDVISDSSNISNIKKSTSKIQEIDFISSWNELTKAYEKTPAVAIDKSVAEKTDSAYAVLASFSWDDVGSWDSFEKHCQNKTENAVLVESGDCFVYSDIPVGICGIDGISVIIKNGKALVMKKGCSSMVRDVVKEFSKKEER